MRVVTEIREMQIISRQLRLSKKTIGFVPTMGAFHQGHLSLIKKARLGCDTVVVSIFVNPLQFGPNEDYKNYPRDIDRDCALASEAGVDLIFEPDSEKFYPNGYCTHVEVDRLADVLCGLSRPGHFRGVTTVVNKLFNIIRPNVAYLGQKDYQQALIIRRMVQDLSIDTDIEILPIARRKDGLALSSRNVYLKKEESKTAGRLYQSLNTAQKMILEGERDAGAIISRMRQGLEIDTMIRIDYMQICDSETLKPLSELNSNKLLVALAVFIGKTRLIDNILVDIPQ